MIDRHLLAAISLGGTLLDLIGGLYLAYDLLGGKKGPLRVITRIATDSVIFGLGYALPLGPRYGLVAGPGSACSPSSTGRCSSMPPCADRSASSRD